MARKSVRRAVLEERAKHLRVTESPALQFHRECIASEMTGKKYESRVEVQEALRQIAKECAGKNPFKKRTVQELNRSDIELTASLATANSARD